MSTTPTSRQAPSSTPDLTHITHWVFDLDHTLYPSDSSVMVQIEQRMTEYVARLLDVDMEAAAQAREQYWKDYGTTLNGLMTNHGVDRQDFLDFVHDIDASVLDPAPLLGQRISALPGRKIIYTNGSLGHAENILDRLGITEHFEDIFDVAAADFIPKPHREGFDRFQSRFGLPTVESVMFEDSLRNLKTAHEMGFTTVLVRAKEGALVRESHAGDEHPEHVHFAVDCLTTFLGDIKTAEHKKDEE